MVFPRRDVRHTLNDVIRGDSNSPRLLPILSIYLILFHFLKVNNIYSPLTRSSKMVKIFITGATGYIGGDTLYELYNKHPEYSYTALVRTAEKRKSVTDKFPKVKTVQGDNDSSDLLKEEASKADIVIREFYFFRLVIYIR